MRNKTAHVRKKIEICGLKNQISEIYLVVLRSFILLSDLVKYFSKIMPKFVQILYELATLSNFSWAPKSILQNFDAIGKFYISYEKLNFALLLCFVIIVCNFSYFSFSFNLSHPTFRPPISISVLPKKSSSLVSLFKFCKFPHPFYSSPCCLCSLYFMHFVFTWNILNLKSV